MDASSSMMALMINQNIPRVRTVSGNKGDPDWQLVIMEWYNVSYTAKDPAHPNERIFYLDKNLGEYEVKVLRKGSLSRQASFTVTEGVGTPEDIDDGMQLGLNYPRGPFGWLEAIGPHHVLAVLDGLRLELGEERYRAAPMLRRLAIEEE